MSIKETLLKYAKNNPEKFLAKSHVQYAVRTGKLIREACEICGKKKTDAHHPDYTKPLDVIWLCRKHHVELHCFLSTRIKDRKCEIEGCSNEHRAKGLCSTHWNMWSYRGKPDIETFKIDVLKVKKRKAKCYAG